MPVIRQKPISLTDLYPNDFVLRIEAGGETAATVWRRRRPVGRVPAVAKRDRYVALVSFFALYEARAAGAGLRLWIDTEHYEAPKKTPAAPTHEEPDDEL